jgi:putative oxidoreductase
VIDRTITAHSGGTTMLNALIATPNDLVLTVIRIVLGVVILPHGLQKVFGWFGGYGIKGTMGWLTGTVGLPSFVAALVLISESLGAAGLILGLFGRLGAFGVLCVMLGAVVTAHLKVGFFMNWNSEAGRGEGYEYHLMAIAMAAIILWQGSGALSLDRLLMQ